MRRDLKGLKLEVYEQKKKGISTRDLSREYKMDALDIKYLVRLIDTYGSEILTEGRRTYSKEFKTTVVEEFLGSSASYNDISIKYALTNSSLLKGWVKAYKDNGCVILEKQKGRPSMKKTTHRDKPVAEMTPEEQIEYWKKRAIYAEAEAEYLKKLHAVVQTRKAQQRKKK